MLHDDRIESFRLRLLRTVGAEKQNDHKFEWRAGNQEQQRPPHVSDLFSLKTEHCS